MAITYDKNKLKKLHNQMKRGKISYAIKTAFIAASFWFVFMMGINYLFMDKVNDDFKFNGKYVGIWFLGAIVMFVFDYFASLRIWDGQKSLYEESIKYHKEHNPSFVEDLE